VVKEGISFKEKNEIISKNKEFLMRYFNKMLKDQDENPDIAINKVFNETSNKPK